MLNIQDFNELLHLSSKIERGEIAKNDRYHELAKNIGINQALVLPSYVAIYKKTGTLPACNHFIGDYHSNGSAMMSNSMKV